MASETSIRGIGAVTGKYYVTDGMLRLDSNVGPKKVGSLYMDEEHAETKAFDVNGATIAINKEPMYRCPGTNYDSTLCITNGMKTVLVGDTPKDEPVNTPSIEAFTTSHLYGDTKNAGYKFVKVLRGSGRDVHGNQIFKQDGMTLRLGENVAVEEWDPKIDASGGICFTIAGQLYKSWDSGDHIGEICIIKNTTKVTDDLKNGSFKAHVIFITKIWTLSDYICAMSADVFRNNVSFPDGFGYLSIHQSDVSIEMLTRLLEYTTQLDPDAIITADNVDKLCKKYPFVIAHLEPLSHDKYVEFYKQHREHDVYFRLTHVKENLEHYRRLIFGKK